MRRWQHRGEGRGALVWAMLAWILALFVCLWLLSCGPRPADQSGRPSVSAGQVAYRAFFFPALEWLVLRGLDMIRPADQAVVADPQEEY